MSRKRINGNEILKMHNSLVEASFYMTDLEMKIFMFMLACVKRDDKEFSEVRIPVRLFGSANSYSEIKTASKRLAKQTIDMELTGERKKFRTIPLVSFCEYEDGWGYLLAEFNEKAKPYLLELKQSFTTAELEQISKIKGSYIIRIYWLLKQYQNSRERQRTVTVDKFWDMFKLHDKKYRYTDFKRQILKVSQKKLENTDMAFEFREIKDGRKVDAIHFKLKDKLDKQQEEAQVLERPDVSPRVLEVLGKYKFTQTQITNIINNLSEEGIFRTNYEIMCDARDKGIINPTGFAYRQFQKKFPIKSEKAS